jgi:hypothetical protein
MPPSPLAALLDPFSEALFFRDHWGRQPLVVPARDRARFDGLFGLREAEEYLFVARPPAGDLRLVKKGEWPPFDMVKGLFAASAQHYDLQAIYDGLSAGYTVIMNGVQFRWSSLRALTAGLEDQLLANVQANAYLTGANGQGFPRHFDDHQVFVLQTHGAKHWQVYAPAAPGADPALLFETVLRQGDLLYIPMGFPHSATTSADYSLHVTLGIYQLTWHELARQSLDRFARQDPWWSEAVPLARNGAAGALDVDRLLARLQAAFGSLDGLTPVVDTYARGLTAGIRRRNPGAGRYLESLATIDALDADTEVERRAGASAVVVDRGETVAIEFMGTAMRAPARAAAALRFIATAPRFRVRDIDATLTDDSKVVLVRRLIRDGLLQLAASGARDR